MFERRARRARREIGSAGSAGSASACSRANAARSSSNSPPNTSSTPIERSHSALSGPYSPNAQMRADGFSRRARGDDGRRQPRGGVHRQVKGDEIGRAEDTVGELLLRRIDARDRQALGAQPGRSRRQAERLPAHFVGADEDAAHHDTIIVFFRHHACCRRGRAPARSRVLRPPARPVDALLHRDVGALQLLRDARAAHPVHDGAGRRRRTRLRHGRRRRRLRPVHVDGVHDQPAGRLDRRSPDRPAPRRALRRHHHRVRPFQHGVSVADHVLSRPRAHRRRHRTAQGQRRGHRRRALRAERCAGATPAFRSTTWASTSARSSRRSSAATSGSASTGTSASAPPASAWCGLVQYVLGAKYLGEAGLHPAPAAARGSRRGGVEARGHLGRGRLSPWSLSWRSAWRPARCRSRRSRSPTPPATCCSSSSSPSSRGCSSGATGRRPSADASTRSARCSSRPPSSGPSSNRPARR